MSGPLRAVFNPQSVLSNISNLQAAVGENGLSGQVDTINDTLDVHLGLVTGLSGG